MQFLLVEWRTLVYIPDKYLFHLDRCLWYTFQDILGKNVCKQGKTFGLLYKSVQIQQCVIWSSCNNIVDAIVTIKLSLMIMLWHVYFCVSIRKTMLNVQSFWTLDVWTVVSLRVCCWTLNLLEYAHLKASWKTINLTVLSYKACMNKTIEQRSCTCLLTQIIIAQMTQLTRPAQ